ncbi:MAG: serine hydrolase [Spirochaetales bacterium]|nr:serine hydrolase [Spirochaetales bacterium]
MKYLLLWFLPLAIPAQPSTNTELEQFLKRIPSTAVQTILHDPARYRFQLFYTPEGAAHPVLSFRSGEEYFYPASLVKLPLALLLLEKMSKGTIPRLTLDSLLQIEGKNECRSTMRELLEKMLVVSDNQSYSCLFHFLGARNIARIWKEKKLPVVLSRPFGEEAGKSPAIRIFSGSRLIFALGEVRYPSPKSLEPIRIGRAYYDGTRYIEKPMDFSAENQLPLETLHELFIDAYSREAVHFQLGPEERKFLHSTLRLPPSRIRHGRGRIRCNSEFRYFFRNHPCRNLPDHIEVSSKAGRAYGFLSDSARIKNRASGKAFYLTAGLYVNANETLNDDIYEYEELGWPALYALGQAFFSLTSGEALSP